MTRKELKIPQSTYGLWEVTTEGDEEGRTTRNLGTHEGHFDEIAFKLASQSYYSLRFRVIDSTEFRDKKPTGTKVAVSFDIGTGTWDLRGEELAAVYEQWFKKNGRKVTVEAGGVYAGVTLYDGESPEAIAKRQREVIRNAALAKLSAAEREALGL